jgi:hypothetical protein
MMIQLAARSIPVILSGVLCSCGCHYKSERFTLREGSYLATHHNGTYVIDRVTAKSITISHTAERFGQGWELEASGRWGGGEPHSLGNNESLKILAVEPFADTVSIELIWRDWCGPLSIPSF